MVAARIPPQVTSCHVLFFIKLLFFLFIGSSFFCSAHRIGQTLDCAFRWRHFCASPAIPNVCATRNPRRRQQSFAYCAIIESNLQRFLHSREPSYWIPAQISHKAVLCFHARVSACLSTRPQLRLVRRKVIIVLNDIFFFLFHPLFSIETIKELSDVRNLGSLVFLAVLAALAYVSLVKQSVYSRQLKLAFAFLVLPFIPGLCSNA